jgi:hypothetical protein
MLDQPVYLMELFQVTDKFSRCRPRTSTDRTRVVVGSGSKLDGAVFSRNMKLLKFVPRITRQDTHHRNTMLHDA